MRKLKKAHLEATVIPRLYRLNFLHVMAENTIFLSRMWEHVFKFLDVRVGTTPDIGPFALDLCIVVMRAGVKGQLQFILKPL
jgi:hypothetical protein